VLPAFGLHTHIAANERRSKLLLAGLFVLVLLLVFAGALLWRALGTGEPGEGTLLDHVRAAGRDTLLASPLAAGATLLWIAGALKFHQGIIGLLAGSDALHREASPRIHDRLEALCISRGMRVPRLRVIESPALNAFASGLDEGSAAITLTRGLVDALDEDELEAVLAHELTHIRNGDVRLMVIAVVVAGVVSLVAELAFRVLKEGRSLRSSSGEGSRKRGAGAGAAVVLGLAVLAVAWALSGVIRFSLSRSREYLADAGAVELTKNPDALIAALLKIRGRGEIPGAPSGIMEMCVDNPRSGLADLFATHPSIEDRVAALVRFAGGRVEEEAASEKAAVGEARAAAPWGVAQPGGA
jgi:heat shock protein HtpX